MVHVLRASTTRYPAGQRGMTTVVSATAMEAAKRGRMLAAVMERWITLIGASPGFGQRALGVRNYVGFVRARKPGSRGLGKVRLAGGMTSIRGAGTLRGPAISAIL
jgi:hypothetical protein